MMTTFFVDGFDGDGLAGGGSDLNNGRSETTPFRTIQRAANVAQAGDTILIRGGTYREQVELIRSGNATLGNITFAAFEDEDVTVTTTDVLTGFTQTPDTTDDPNVFVATLNGSPNNSLLNRHSLSAFVDGELIREANSNNNADLLDIETFDTYDSATINTITDASLIGSTDDLVGAVLQLRTTAFTLLPHRIAAFDSSTGTITIEGEFGTLPRDEFYLIHDARDLLDAPGEFFFQEETNQFFLYAPNGGDPDNFTVEVGRRDEAFDLNGRDFIEFRNLNFTGGDLETAGSDNLVIDGVHFLATDRSFGPDFGSSVTRTALVINGDNNIIRNSTFEQTFSAAIRLQGDNNVVTNNLFTEGSLNGGGSGGIAFSGTASDNLISRNTFTRQGRSAIVATGSTAGNIIENNEFSEVALLTEDTGAIYYFNVALGNTVIRENIFRDIDAPFSSGVYVDNFVSDLIVHNNISFNTTFSTTINIPSSNVLYFNNTIFDAGFSSAFFPTGVSNSVFGNQFFNNFIGAGLDSDLFNSFDPISEGATFQSQASDFVNAAARDFRLQAGSRGIDAGVVVPGINDDFNGAAPDIGAIEFGEELFAFGHDFENPPPAPAFNFTLPAGANLVNNSGFEAGLAGFTTVGTPTLFNANASNFRDEVLGRIGQRSVQLDPGESVTQTITGLRPDTTFTLAGFARTIGGIIQAEDFDSTTSSTAGTRSFRGETTVDNISGGDEFIFNSVDFGNGTAVFDQLQLFFGRTGSGDSVQVFIDNEATPRDVVTIPENIEVHTPTTANLGTLTGTHTIRLVIQGSGEIGFFDSLRLVESANTQPVLLQATGFDGPGSVIQENIGTSVPPTVTPRFTFRTGPNSTTAQISFINPGDSAALAFVDNITLFETEPTTVDTSQARFDFDIGTSSTLGGAVQPGFQVLTPDVAGDISFVPLSGNGTVTAIDRGAGAAGANGANRDFAESTAPFEITHRLAPGVYTVSVNLNDPLEDVDNISIFAEDELALGDIDNAAGEFETRSFQVTVTDGELNLAFFDADTVDPRIVLNRLSIVQVEAFGPPLLPGDFNGDAVVSAADFTVFRDLSGSTGTPFVGIDHSGNGVVGAEEFDLFVQNFGAEAPTEVTTVLIGPNIRNGDFTDIGDGEEADDFNPGAGRSLVNNGVFDVPGFRFTRTAFLGGNPAFGIDGLPLLGSGALDPVAFVNNDLVNVGTIPGEEIPFIFNAGDRLDLEYDLGSDTAGAFARAVVTLTFDRGLATEFSTTFNQQNVTNAGGPQRLAESFTLTQSASTVAVDFLLGVFQNQFGVFRTQLDNIELTVTSPTQSAVAALVAPESDAAEARISAADVPADNTPAVSIPPLPVINPLPPFFEIDTSSAPNNASALIQESTTANETALSASSSNTLVTIPADAPAEQDNDKLYTSSSGLSESALDTAFSQLDDDFSLFAF